MAKKKKKRKKKEEVEDQQESKFEFNISSDAKRDIVAIFLFALSILFGLGFFGNAGMLGEYLDKSVGLLFGSGKWLFPLVLIISGIVLFYRKKTSFYVSKIVGLAVAFLSILGFLHIYLDQDKFLEIAKGGEGGGYAGYVIAYLLIKLTGTTAGTVILIAVLLIGIIIAFNFSIINFFSSLKNSKDEEDEDESESEDEEEKEKAEEKKDEDTAVEREFVKDPNEKDKEEEKKKSFFGSFKEKNLKKKDEDSFIENEEIEVADDSDWQKPPLDLLEASSGEAQGGDVEGNAEIIQKTLGHFGIEVERGDIQTGPTITQYTFRPAVGIKLSRITSLNNDLALALAAHPIRIEAPIPGKSLIGIEVPNKSVATVRMKEIVSSAKYKKSKSDLLLSLGKDVSGDFIFENLAKMPHLMIAGSTGTGKSVCINSVLLSLLYRNSPEELKLILVDPKRVELSLYNGIPHLLSDVIVDNGKVLSALKWAIGEMERRYALFQETGSRDLSSYNQKSASGHKHKSLDEETGEVREEFLKRLPYIVIVIDELADLMASHGKEVEAAIIRLAQMARAVGIHLIVSTQRPSVEVLTGLIKANITTRIAFKVATQIDSRTILDTSGAEKLLGNGDMLYVSSNSKGLKRLQGVFISESEVKRVVKFIKKQKIEKGEEEIGEDIASGSKGDQEQIDFESVKDSKSDQEEDSMYEEAKSVVIESKKASASLLQRRLRVGYARAARLIDILEERGIVGPGEGAKPREVFIKPGDTEYEDPGKDQESRDKWQI